MCLTKDGAYAKIQMWLSAKWVSAHLHKHFHTNTKTGTEKSQHITSALAQNLVSASLNMPLTRTPEVLSSCEQLSQITQISLQFLPSL